MKPRKPDYVLLIVVATLVVFGLVMLSSASMVKSQETFDQPYYYLMHQILYGVLPAILIAFLVYKISYKYWQKFSFPIYIATLIILVLVFLPGLSFKSGGATRWIAIGPATFQPSEFAKLGFIIYLAAWLANKSKEKNVDSWKEGFFPFIITAGIICGLIVIQPNIGTAGLIGIVAMFMLFAAGGRFLQVGTLAIAGAAVFLSYTKIYSHAADRFKIFLHPELDPKGIGYQINQALLAIGSGGIFGRGLGQSIQKYNYLPEPMGDSIFAIIAEELGFIGVIILLALFILLAFRGYQIAKKAPDDLGRFLAVGITSWLVLQAFLNIAAISGLMPLTGIPLPLVSYGGSALIVSLTGIGILLNISRHTK